MMDISCEQLKTELESNQNLIVVDVREDWEFDLETLGQYNISLYELPQRFSEFKKWEDKKVVVHCNTGKRSNQARKFLAGKGITNVWSLSGGIVAYKEFTEKEFQK